MSKKFAKPADVKVGVVGYGAAFNMGAHHFREMQLAGMTPVAVADMDPARRKAAEDDFAGIETYDSLEKMLKKSDVNLITLITPHNLHANQAIKALKSGRHVVCEKPLAITTAECDAMIAAAKKSDVVLSTYHNRHWDGAILEALKHINKGEIGDVSRIEIHMCNYGKPGDWWRTSKTISGGILYDWGVHLLEYCLQILQADLVEVSGFANNGFWADKTKWKDDTNEDEAFVTARFTGGKWLSLKVSTMDSNPQDGWITITGTKGSYVLDGEGYKVFTHKAKSDVLTKGKNQPNQWAKFYQNIADHLTKGTELVISPEWARRPIHIIDLGIRSAKQGKALKAKYK